MTRRLLIIALALFAVIAAAQFRGRGPQRGSDRGQIPTWEVNPQFKEDVFTFVRVEYNSGGGRGRGFGGGGWMNDYPNADLNFSWRLHQMTSLEVQPSPPSMRLTDPRLNDYPFLFMNDPRSIQLDDEEVAALRNYLLNGGFLMIDDFWGNPMWQHIERQMQVVFPDRKWRSLPAGHPIYRLVFPLAGPPQVPSHDSAHNMKDAPDPYRTWEYDFSDVQPQPADFRGYFDDQDRLMMLVCWNTDLSDGWEEEAFSPWFFENFSEKFSYPMGINILTYVMTH